jgi:hypothetical protein
MRRWILAFSMLPLFGTVGCGSDADDSPMQNDGTIDNKLIKDLTPQEGATLCAQNEGNFDTLITAACTAQAWLTTEGIVAECMSARDTCAGDPSWDSLDCSSFNPADASTCPLTVGQLKACLGESLSFAPNITCDATDPPDPPACVSTLVDDCLPPMQGG